jgi:hypothetical protein
MSGTPIFVKELTCPVCGAKEVHSNGTHVHIRGFKVHDQNHWWSQCLVCSGGYDRINGAYTHANHDGNKGWF